MEAFDIMRPLENRLDPSYITDYLVRRFSIAGTPEECAARVREIAQAGMSHFMLTPPERIYTEMVEAWAKEVMPLL